MLCCEIKMFQNVDHPTVSKLISLQRDNVTCIECCKYYTSPHTAVCGHSLCQVCWHGRRSCAVCSKPVNRTMLKLNTPLKCRTEHVLRLVQTFETLFNLNLDEFILNTPMESENNLTKNVKNWLDNSQNHFSAPPPSSQDILPTVELSKSNLQIHEKSNKSVSPKKVIHVPPPQDDWDKIEELQDTEEITKNIAGPMDVEPYNIEDIEYTTGNPRRSSRKKDSKSNDVKIKKNDVSIAKQSSINSNSETDKKTVKSKQNWSNVKRMRKEFSKLNKQNRNKLNVSIEMCKKTNAGNKIQPQNLSPPHQLGIVIDDNTPDVINLEKDKESVELNKENIEFTEKLPEENAETLQVVSTDLSIQQCNKQNDIKENPSPTTQSHALTNVPFIKKSTLWASSLKNNTEQPVENQTDLNSGTVNTDDIEITIKIGNTITNITIKKNDVNFKVNTDREVQTSLQPHISINNVKQSMEQREVIVNNVQINLDSMEKKDFGVNTKIMDIENISQKPTTTISKTIAIKKHTDSADTATAQFDITESVEKEMSNLMECVENASERKTNSDIKEDQNVTEKTQNAVVCENHKETIEEMDVFNEFDIFASGSIKESNVQLLKKTKNTPSEILVPTGKTYRRNTNFLKRSRNNSDKDENTTNKKQKSELETRVEMSRKEKDPDSENINYENIMGTVFANIDADIDEMQKSQKTNRTCLVSSQVSQMLPQTIKHNSKEISRIVRTQITKEAQVENEKYSENIFSNTQDTSSNIEKANIKIPGPDTQKCIDHLLTPVLCEDLAALEDHMQIEQNIVDVNPSTPCHEIDDSDRSVVEETPQKKLSFSKLKLKNDGSDKTLSIRESDPKQSNADIEKLSAQKSKSVINVIDSSTNSNQISKNVTVIETDNARKHDSPFTIDKFGDQIKHGTSTPMAKKCLSFNRQTVEDLGQTLCSNTVAKTTQEREFMSKAFEKTPSPCRKPLVSQNIERKKYYIAGSCLTAAEQTNVKLLCKRHNMVYSDKYSKELTHLVVSVDEERKAQRSVKYMCALAAGKWIISYEWVEQCLKLKKMVNEEPFEALDSTGDLGPQRSRLATEKLFKGITFFCMQPFTILNIETLQEMLIAAGGRVVKEAAAVRVNDDSLAILLAEPEHTQVDKFIYMAMELSIVPVNYEWAMNCLGCYTLCSIQDLLLCPVSLLPPATKKWPAVLMNKEFDSFS